MLHKKMHKLLHNILRDLLGHLRRLGALRSMLQATALVLTLLMPLAWPPDRSAEDWNMFFDGILPAIAPIVVIVILLDIMMSHIWKSDADEPSIIRLNQIIKAHLLVGGLLLAAWLGYFLPRL